MSVVDEVKQRLDIVEVIGEYVPLAKAGRNFRALCPFHSEKHPSFYVYPERQSWHCFGACSTGGDAFSFVMQKEGLDFGEALHLLARRAGVTIPSKIEAGVKKDERERLYQANMAAAQYFHNLLLNSPNAEAARKYIADRGLSPKSVTGFQLGFSPPSRQALKPHLMEKGYTERELVTAGLIVEGETGETHDRFRHKLMFPIFDTRGQITGFGARVLDDSQPKYINSPQTPVFDKSSSLYAINLAAATIRHQDLAVIVEGYMDTITAHQNGFNNVVASMGISVTEKQVSGLKRLTKNMVLALDADTAGEEAMLRGVGYENTLNAEVRVIILPKGKDPDDVIREDAPVWVRLQGEALPVVDYTFNMVTAKLDMNTARDKSLAVERLLPIVAEIKDLVRQEHYLQKLATLVKGHKHTLEAVLKRLKPSPVRRLAETPKPVSRFIRPMVSSPVEGYFLALLLQHPRLKADYQGLSAEYFENTENREIFIAWQQADSLAAVKEELDPAIHEHLDALASQSLPSTQVEQRYSDCILNLRKTYLQGLEAKRAEALALIAESGGATGELAKLEEQGVEVSMQLGEIFAKKRQARSGPKGVTS
ncbi:DNA primase [Chloroflexota bacterium]